MLNQKASVTTMMQTRGLLSKHCQIMLAVSLALTLAACGESDLEELHAERIEAALNDAAQEQDVLLGEALPVEGAGVPAPSAATRQAINPEEFDLVFNDEFNDTTLDSTKWNSAMAWGPDLIINDEEQYYVDTQTNPDSAFNPFSFDGEALIITATRTPTELEGSTNDQGYVSGALTTLDNFGMQYGYVEARVDVPAGAGLWPSMWMLGTEFEGLKPQLYLMEFNGGTPDSFFHNYNYTDEDGNLRSPRQHEVVVNGASTGFHTIGVRWSVGELTYYVNGFPTFQVNGENVASQAMYFIMNLAVGGLWVDSPDETTPESAEFKVDYIRVYQRN